MSVFPLCHNLGIPKRHDNCLDTVLTQLTDHAPLAFNRVSLTSLAFHGNISPCNILTREIPGFSIVGTHIHMGPIPIGGEDMAIGREITVL